jgi:hypothetical protein
MQSKQKVTPKFRELLKALDEPEKDSKMGDGKKIKDGIFTKHLDWIVSIRKPKAIGNEAKKGGSKKHHKTADKI